MPTDEDFEYRYEPPKTTDDTYARDVRAALSRYEKEAVDRGDTPEQIAKMQTAILGKPYSGSGEPIPVQYGLGLLAHQVAPYPNKAIKALVKGGAPQPPNFPDQLTGTSGAWRSLAPVQYATKGQRIQIESWMAEAAEYQNAINEIDLKLASETDPVRSKALESDRETFEESRDLQIDLANSETIYEGSLSWVMRVVGAGGSFVAANYRMLADTFEEDQGKTALRIKEIFGDSAIFGAIRDLSRYTAESFDSPINAAESGLVPPLVALGPVISTPLKVLNLVLFGEEPSKPAEPLKPTEYQRDPPASYKSQTILTEQQAREVLSRLDIKDVVSQPTLKSALFGKNDLIGYYARAIAEGALVSDELARLEDIVSESEQKSALESLARNYLARSQGFALDVLVPGPIEGIQLAYGPFKTASTAARMTRVTRGTAIPRTSVEEFTRAVQRDRIMLEVSDLWKRSAAMKKDVPVPVAGTSQLRAFIDTVDPRLKALLVSPTKKAGQTVVLDRKRIAILHELAADSVAKRIKGSSSILDLERSGSVMMADLMKPEALKQSGMVFDVFSRMRGIGKERFGIRQDFIDEVTAAIEGTKENFRVHVENKGSVVEWLFDSYRVRGKTRSLDPAVKEKKSLWILDLMEDALAFAYGGGADTATVARGVTKNITTAAVGMGPKSAKRAARAFFRTNIGRKIKMDIMLAAQRGELELVYQELGKAISYAHKYKLKELNQRINSSVREAIAPIGPDRFMDIVMTASTAAREQNILSTTMDRYSKLYPDTFIYRGDVTKEFNLFYSWLGKYTNDFLASPAWNNSSAAFNTKAQAAFREVFNKLDGQEEARKFFAGLVRSEGRIVAGQSTGTAELKAFIRNMFRGTILLPPPAVVLPGHKPIPNIYEPFINDFVDGIIGQTPAAEWAERLQAARSSYAPRDFERLYGTIGDFLDNTYAKGIVELVSVLAATDPKIASEISSRMGYSGISKAKEALMLYAETARELLEQKGAGASRAKVYLLTLGHWLGIPFHLGVQRGTMEAAKRVVDFYDLAHRVSKSAATVTMIGNVPNVAYHTSNYLTASSVAMSAIGGKAFESYSSRGIAHQLLNRVFGGGDDIVSAIAAPAKWAVGSAAGHQQMFTDTLGRVWFADELIDLIISGGISKSQMSSELGASTLKQMQIWAKLNPSGGERSITRRIVDMFGGYGGSASKLANYFDAVNRTQVFVDTLRSTGRVELAKQMARESQVDYSTLTWLERVVVQRVFQFYVFRRQMALNAIKNLANNPGRIRVLGMKDDLISDLYAEARETYKEVTGIEDPSEAEVRGATRLWPTAPWVDHRVLLEVMNQTKYYRTEKVLMSDPAVDGLSTVLDFAFTFGQMLDASGSTVANSTQTIRSISDTIGKNTSIPVKMMVGLSTDINIQKGWDSGMSPLIDQRYLWAAYQTGNFPALRDMYDLVPVEPEERYSGRPYIEGEQWKINSDTGKKAWFLTQYFLRAVGIANSALVVSTTEGILTGEEGARFSVPDLFGLTSTYIVPTEEKVIEQIRESRIEDFAKRTKEGP